MLFPEGSRFFEGELAVFRDLVNGKVIGEHSKCAFLLCRNAPTPFAFRAPLGASFF